MRQLLPLLLFVVVFSPLFGGTRDSLTNIVESHLNQEGIVNAEFERLISQQLKDAFIHPDPKEIYYLTGTSGDINGVQTGIRMWASRDLQEWNLVGRNDGFVFKFENDADEWQKEISTVDGVQKRGAMAPKITIVRDTFYLSYSNSNSGKIVILKSMTGRGFGPYNEISTDSLARGEHPFLFQDIDSTLYLVWDKGKVQRLREDVKEFEERVPETLVNDQGEFIDLENITIQHIDSVYYLSGSRWSQSVGSALKNTYDGVVMEARQLMGPYRERLLITNAGGGHLFKSFDDNFYFAYGNSSMNNPLTYMPGLVQLKRKDQGSFEIHQEKLIYPGEAKVVYVSKGGNNSTGENWDDAYTSIQRAIDNSPNGSQLWIAGGMYEGPISINLRKSLYIYGGFRGNEKLLEEREIDRYKVIINGRDAVRNVLTVKSSSYIRIDGITVRGGNASGGSMYMQYGGGMHILGGGSTIRIVNCSFEGNTANQDGGALYVSNGAAPLLISCNFHNNVAKKNGGAIAFFGNRPNGYSLRLVNCTFDDNFSYGEGSAVYFDSRVKGYGLLEIQNCLMTNNTSLGESGVLYLDGYANLEMINTTLCFNKGTTQGAVIGRMGSVPAKSRITNSLFYKNFGGVLFSIEGEAETIEKGETIAYKNIWFRFENCLFEDNQVHALIQRNFDSRQWQGVDGLNQSVLCRDCIQGDPNFVDPANNNYQLSANSRAKNRGDTDVFFPFNIEGERRKNGVNIGCY